MILVTYFLSIASFFLAGILFTSYITGNPEKWITIAFVLNIFWAVYLSSTVVQQLIKFLN